MSETDQQEYQLKDGITRVHRSGLVLEADQTIEAYPDILNEHGDVLEPVDSDTSDGDSVDGDGE